MGVRTTADERRDKSKEHVNNAIAEIAQIVVDEVYGSEDYTDEYKLTLREVLNELLVIRDRL